MQLQGFLRAPGVLARAPGETLCASELWPNMDAVAAPMGPPGNPATPRAVSSSSPPPAADDRRLLPETGRYEDLEAFPARPVSPTDSLAQLPPLPRPPLPSVRLVLPSVRLFFGFGLGDGPPASSGSIERALRARLRLRFPCQEFEEHRVPCQYVPDNLKSKCFSNTISSTPIACHERFVGSARRTYPRLAILFHFTIPNNNEACYPMPFTIPNRPLSSRA